MFTLLALLPIVVVVLVLSLKGVRNSTPAIVEGTGDVKEKKENVDESAISTIQNSRVASLDGTAVDHHPPFAVEKFEHEMVGAKNPHIPEAGYGPTPLNRKELLENAAFIVLPALLLTIEQGIRVAQVYYLPTRGEELP